MTTDFNTKIDQHLTSLLREYKEIELISSEEQKKYYL